MLRDKIHATGCWLVPALLTGILAILAIFFWSARERHSETSQAAVLLQVRRLNQLTTVRYVIQRVVGLKDTKKPFGEESILLIITANVEAGIDLAAMKPEDVRMGPNQAVAIRLPPGRVLNVALVEKDTQVWDRQKTWWTPWVPYSLDLEQRARIKGLESAKAAALEMGILTQAQENAKASIRALLSLGKVKSFVFSYDPAD